MARKKNKKWCDTKYETKTTKFGVEEMAKAIYDTLEEYILNDVRKDIIAKKIPEEGNEEVGELQRDYLLHRFEKMTDMAERIELYVRDANSIYALYACDYEYRRKVWLAARGCCFRLRCMLDHMTELVVSGTNIQKYVDISADVDNLSERIKGVIISDDRRRKEKCKDYEGSSCNTANFANVNGNGNANYNNASNTNIGVRPISK